MEEINQFITKGKAEMAEHVAKLQKDLATIRTGRASAQLLENIRVDYYGTPTPIKQMALINVLDAKTLEIQPWDISSLNEIDKALQKAEEKFRSVLYHTDIDQETGLSDELGFGTDYFLVGTLQLLTPEKQSLEQMMNWTTIISGMLRDLMEVDGRYEIFRDYENHLVVLMNFNSEEAMKNFKTYELEDLKQSLKNQLGLESVLGIGPLCYHLSDVRLA